MSVCDDGESPSPQRHSANSYPQFELLDLDAYRRQGQASGLTLKCRLAAIPLI
ncbi:hypothetical protein B0H13DRAFT_2350318 [Mycena leptocephala]|nr:hypothetical protein B0H13DRAFT_2350318 [Mycena leptocephala]